MTLAGTTPANRKLVRPIHSRGVATEGTLKYMFQTGGLRQQEKKDRQRNHG